MKQRGTGRKCAKKRWGLELPMRWMIGASEAVVRLAKKKRLKKRVFDGPWSSIRLQGGSMSDCSTAARVVDQPDEPEASTPLVQRWPTRLDGLALGSTVSPSDMEIMPFPSPKLPRVGHSGRQDAPLWPPDLLPVSNAACPRRFSYPPRSSVCLLGQVPRQGSPGKTDEWYPSAGREQTKRGGHGMGAVTPNGLAGQRCDQMLL